MLAVTREIDTFESDERRRSRTTSDKSKYTVTAATAFYRIIVIDWLITHFTAIISTQRRTVMVIVEKAAVYPLSILTVMRENQSCS